MIRRLLARLGTLRWRLTLFYCGLLAMLLAAVGISVYVRFGDALKRNASSRLHDLGMILTPALSLSAKFGDLTTLESIKANTELLDYIKSQLLQNQSSTAIYIGVLDSNGELVLDNQPFKQAEGIETIKPKFLSVEAVDSIKGASAQEYETTLDIEIAGFSGGEKKTSQIHGLAYVMPVAKLSEADIKKSNALGRTGTPTLYLALIAPLDEADNAMQTIAYILVTGLLAALVIALLLGLPIARLGLKPLRKMTDTATQIGAGEMSRRVEVRARGVTEVNMKAGDEVQELAQAFNAMLDRLEASFEAQVKSEARTRQFAADASHEMRSPLTVLGGYLDVLLMGAKDDPVQTERILGAMQRENNRLGRLVVDLLLLTRMDANANAWLRVEALQLSDIVNRAVDNMRMAAGVGRALHVSIGEDACELKMLGDGDQLYRVVTNLLDNAIRYTGPHGQIEVSLRRSEYEGGWVRLQIADDGCGIEAWKLPRIFDRFYRADESRTRNTGNAGLGLAICKSIVEAHGGRIGVESEVGLGTVFTIELPVMHDSQRTLSGVSATSKAALLN